MVFIVHKWRFILFKWVTKRDIQQGDILNIIPTAVLLNKRPRTLSLSLTFMNLHMNFESAWNEKACFTVFFFTSKMRMQMRNKEKLNTVDEQLSCGVR